MISVSPCDHRRDNSCNDFPISSNASSASDLRRRLIDGQLQALAELFEQYRDQLRQLVHHRSNSRLAGRLDPDDILQQAFLEAMARLIHYRRHQPLTPFAWLRMIVLQTLIDAHRRHITTRQRDARRETSLNAGLELADFRSTRTVLPCAAAVESELENLLRAAIESMQPNDRDVLTLRLLEDRSNQDAATAMSVTPKTASIRYKRAIVRLRKLLEEKSYVA